MRIAENIIRNRVYNNVPKVDTLINSIIPKKVCKKCGQEKPVTEFTKSKNIKDGYENKCKKCRGEARKRYNKICEVCGEPYLTSKKNSKYCSPICTGISRQNRIAFNCEVCGEPSSKIASLYNSENHHYCSKECANIGFSMFYSGENNPCYDSVTLKCEYCGESYLTSNKNSKYCSIECCNKDKKGKYKYNKICSVCGKEFIGGSINAKYCSDECKSKRFVKVCEYCGKEFRTDHNNARFCDKKCAGSLTVNRVTYNCEICGKPNSVPKSVYDGKKHHYCSYKCANIGNSIFYSGENSHSWNPDKPQEEREEERKYPEYYEWRKNVYERDHYTCQCCGDNRGHNLEAHHLNGYNWDIEHRTDVDNGVTLCEDCHKEFHNIYGYGNNTKEQFEEFINNRDNKSA